MNKTILLLMAFLVLFTGALFAGGQAEAGEEKATLVFTSWRTEDIDRMNRINDVFESENPGIEVDFQPIKDTEYDAQLKSSLATGVAAVNTDERLQALADNGELALVDARNLTDALHCLQRLRLQHHVEQQMRGEPLSNFLNPRQLPKMAREQLRDAFAIIHDAQQAVRLRFRQGMS